MAERLVSRHLQQAGVSGEQLALLSLIATVEPITPTALAAEMGVPLTTLVDALRRLEGRGELERSPNPADQRSHLITLSAEGRTRLEEVEPPLRQAAAELGAELRLDERDVDQALEDLHRALRSASSYETRSN
jgi:DNA-binding MarR family transcriptional regulator